MKKFALCILLIAAVLNLQACNTDEGSDKPAAVSEKNDKPLRFGFMICDSQKLSQERFAPFAAYLEEQLGRKVEMILKNTFEFEKL
ncbi:MAG: hypothetical protein D3903_03095, partial [Candidatus Electrothrix sp. GM3_4]|nr:hypothetical protein [Candidatus Electrothrix sp. GM3_4]